MIIGLSVVARGFKEKKTGPDFTGKPSTAILTWVVIGAGVSRLTSAFLFELVEDLLYVGPLEQPFLRDYGFVEIDSIETNRLRSNRSGFRRLEASSGDIGDRSQQEVV